MPSPLASGQQHRRLFCCENSEVLNELFFRLANVCRKPYPSATFKYLVIHSINVAVLETKVKKWGNSFGVIIPKAALEKERIRENEKIMILIVKNGAKALSSTFGIAKPKKSSQQIKNELRTELYG